MRPIRPVVMVIVLIGVMAGAAGDARAQGFISPLIGYNFGGDAGCPEITNCEDKRLNWGVSFGAMGPVLGFEEEFAYAKNFFGESDALSSNSVLTLMSNLMLIPALGPFRPYGLVGLGLIKTHTELTTEELLSTDNNNFGWDVGGGLMIFFGSHVGIRGDIRYFHAFQDLQLVGVDLGSKKLDFGRAGGALVFKF